MSITPSQITMEDLYRIVLERALRAEAEVRELRQHLQSRRAQTVIDMTHANNFDLWKRDNGW